MNRTKYMAICGRLARFALLLVVFDAAMLEAEWYRGRYEIDSVADAPATGVQSGIEVGAEPDAGSGLASVTAPLDHMNYLLYLPNKAGLPNRGRGNWPLILSLHGKGQEGEDDDLLLLHGLPRIAAVDPDFPFAVLAPHMPVSLPWGASVFAAIFELAPELWGDSADASMPEGLRQALGEHGIMLGPDSFVVAHSRLKVIYSPAAAGLRIYTVFKGQDRLTVNQLQWRAADAVIGILDEVLAQFEIDPGRVYLTGLSAGGFGAFDLAAVFPDRFAAVAPIAGGGDPDLAPLLRHVPVWAFHGDADRINSPYYTQSMVEALQAIGADARLTLYPGLGHNVWDLAYADPGLFEWFLGHSLEEATAPASTAGAAPGAFALGQNYPNPFNPETIIAFDLPSTGWAELSLHNALGQSVATLVKGLRRAGSYQLRWDGTDDSGRRLAAGLYLYRLTSGGQTAVRRLVLLR